MKETKEAIFRAATEQLADHGLAEFNIPRLAEAAGVSVRTVYRYFPTKEALLEAFAEWLDERIGSTVLPANAEGLLEGVAPVFAAFDDNEDVILSQWVTPQGRAIREKGRLRRLAAVEGTVKKTFPHLSPRELRQATAIFSLLHSSRTWAALKDDFGMPGRESGKVVEWALKTLIADLKCRDEEAARQQGNQAYTNKK